MVSFTFIGCGDLKLTMLLPFIAPIFCYLNSLAITHLTDHWNTHACLFLLFVSFGEFLSGLILSLIGCILKSEKNHSHEDHNTIKKSGITIIKPDFVHERVITYCLLLIPSFCYTISMFIYFKTLIHVTGQVTKLNGIIFQIALASLFCYFFLKYTYHRHHLWSFLLMIIGFFIILPTSLDNFCGNNSLWYLFIYYICYFFFSTSEVFYKWLMDNRFIKPSLILLVEGIIGVIVALIMIAILDNVTCTQDLIDYGICDKRLLGKSIESFDYIKDLFKEPQNYWMYISFMVTNSFFNILVKYTIFHYTPTHRSAVDLLSCVFSTITWEFSKHTLALNYFLYIIGYLIIFIGTLIYNEFIIIYWCGFNEYTKIAINKRKDEESNKMSDDIANMRLVEE